MRTGVAGEEVPERILHRLGEGLGDAYGQRGSQRVAQPARVLDRGPVRRPADADLDGTAGRRQLPGPLRLGAALGELRAGERSEDAQEIGDPLDVLDLPVVGQPLQLALQLAEDVGVQQLPKLRLPEQLGQQVGVEREGGGPPLGQRGVALVEELCDVTEQEGAGERGGLLGGHLDQADTAGLQVAHQLGEPRDVEDVLEALADGFEDDRERAELGGHLEQLGRPLTLLPERGALPRTPAGQQQGPRRALAETGGEQGRAAHLIGDDLADLPLVEDHIGGTDGRLFAVEAAAGEDGSGCAPGGVLRRGAGARLDGVEVEEVEAHHVGVRQPQHDAVVRVHDLRVHAVPLAEPGGQGERPGGVHLGPERRVDHDPPVAQLVAEPLDEDGPVVRDVTARAALLLHVRQDVVRRPGVEAGGEQPEPGVLRRESADLPEERAQRTPQFQRAAQLVALPERQPPRDSRGRRDQDPVPGDVLDPPGRGAQGEDVADPGLVHHLLVQLTDPAAALLRIGAGQEDPEEPAVGDGAAGRHGESLGAGAARDRTGDPVPDHPRAQLGEGVGRIASGEHVEHGRERRFGQ